MPSEDTEARGLGMPESCTGDAQWECFVAHFTDEHFVGTNVGFFLPLFIACIGPYPGTSHSIHQSQQLLSTQPKTRAPPVS